jgi:hypothetical protein
LLASFIFLMVPQAPVATRFATGTCDLFLAGRKIPSEAHAGILNVIFLLDA